MNNFKIFFTVLLILPFTIAAQNFNVISVVGKATKADGTAIVPNMVLKSSDKIKLDPNSVLGMIYNQNKAVELKAGSHDLLTVEKNVIAKKQDFSSKYLTKVVNQTTALGNISTLTAKNGTVVLNSPFSNVSPLNGSNVLNDVKFTWTSPIISPKSYNFFIKNAAGTEVFKKEVTTNSITLKLSDIKLVVNEKYTWFVSTDKGSTSPFDFKVLAPVFAMKVNSDISKIKSELNDSPQLQKMTIAQYYEDNGMLSEAAILYAELAKENDSETFRQTYSSFLNRTSTKGKAKSN